MARSVAASAGEGVDIAGDVAVAVPTGSACRVVRLLLLYLSDWPISDCFREVVWLAMLTAQPPSLADFSLQSGQSEVAHMRGLQHELAVDNCHRWLMWLVLCGAGRGQRAGDFSMGKSAATGGSRCSSALGSVRCLRSVG